MNNIKVRFAPSPTGYLHVGGLRTALYNYLFAKKNNGKIILRIEDTDQSRIVEGASDSLIKIFNKFDIIFDEGPHSANIGESYFQSNRIKLYRKYSNLLLKNGHAYKCYLLPEELVKIRKEAERKKRGAKFIRNEIRSFSANNSFNRNEHVVRLKVPDDAIILFDDNIRGQISINSNELDDQVLMKADGFPTYHLANVVDDYEMGITHVIRGEEWLSSTPKHILLYNSFGYSLPEFSHLPLLLNSDKTKLSKRQGDVSVDDFLENGYMPEALLNFISLLGWHPEKDNEILSIEELIKSFSLDRVQKGGAVFDLNKLNWLNSQYIKQLTFDEFISKSKRHFPKYATNNDKVNKIFDIIKNRIKTFTELDKEMFMFYHKLSFNSEDYKFLSNPINQSILNYWVEYLSGMNELNKEKISLLINKTGERFNVKGRDLFFPIRLCIYGNVHGPSIPEICDIIGKEELLIRLNNSINHGK